MLEHIEICYTMSQFLNITSPKRKHVLSLPSGPMHFCTHSQLSTAIVEQVTCMSSIAVSKTWLQQRGKMYQ